jgi:hypothetical protein
MHKSFPIKSFLILGVISLCIFINNMADSCFVKLKSADSKLSDELSYELFELWMSPQYENVSAENLVREFLSKYSTPQEIADLNPVYKLYQENIALGINDGDWDILARRSKLNELNGRELINAAVKKFLLQNEIACK